MDKNTYIYLVIIGMAIVTFIPRVAPLLFFSKYDMSKKLKKFISYFPVSILASLVVAELFFIDGKMVLNLTNPNLVPGLLTLLVSIKFKSLSVSIVVGIILYILFGYIF